MKILKLKTKQGGLTLIELMITTIIIAIIASAAVPTMKSLFERKNIFSIGDHFVKTIKLARVEAIQRGRTVNVLPTAPDNNGVSDWSQGWRIEFTNNDDPNNIIIEIIRIFPELRGSPVFSSNDYNSNDGISIAPTGQASPLGDFELHYLNCQGEQHLTFEILTSGLVKRGVSLCL
jgi:prepilin-type N-terminal cleavage/methylation domain-containing protein